MGADTGSIRRPEPEWVEEQDRLEALVEEWTGLDRYSFDTEFHRERTYFPKLALVQVGWGDQVALVDPFAVDVKALAPLFQAGGTMVAHAGDQDIEVLELACGVAPGKLFDTQVAAGFLGLSTPSLARLAESLLGVDLPKGDRLTDWTRRPLTPGQRSYAASDVIYLDQIRAALVARLESLGRLAWAEQECFELVERRRQPTPPEQAWWRMRDSRSLRGRSRGVAQEVAAWRERRAARLDRPVRHVLPDMALASIAHRPPRNRSELLAVRGLEGRSVGKEAEPELLAAVQRGLELPAEALHLPVESSVNRDRRAAVALAAAWVAQLGEELEVDANLLATRVDLGDLLSGRASRLDTGWRAEVVGRPVRALAAGGAALAFDGRGGLLLEERSHRPLV
jgi:ribonuclease D